MDIIAGHDGDAQRTRGLHFQIRRGHHDRDEFRGGPVQWRVRFRRQLDGHRRDDDRCQRGTVLATPSFIGNIFDAAGISLGHFANLGGRALAFGGTVTTDANTITVPTCSTGAAVPTLSEWAVMALSLLLALAGAVAMRLRRSPFGPHPGV